MTVGNLLDSADSIVFTQQEGFVTYEAQRKSKCAKVLFSVANSQLLCCCWYFKENGGLLFTTIPFECCPLTIWPMSLVGSSPGRASLHTVTLRCYFFYVFLGMGVGTREGGGLGNVLRTTEHTFLQVSFHTPQIKAWHWKFIYLHWTPRVDFTNMVKWFSISFYTFSSLKPLR